MANFWPLRTPGDPKGFHALLDQTTCEPLISFHVLKLFASRFGTQLLASKPSSGAASPWAGMSDDGKRLTLLVVNKSPLPRELMLDVALRGFAPRAATASALTCPETTSEQFQEGKLAPTADGDCWRCRLPPHSLGVLEFTR
ncbi:MAG: hypothetical protein FJ279_37905 [Planctomycetes bacterium]|nr:hypothetical protein [Planctomycetota bacterium]